VKLNGSEFHIGGLPLAIFMWIGVYRVFRLRREIKPATSAES